MKYKLHAFFSGRNGFDALGRAVLRPAMVLLVLSCLCGAEWLRTALYGAALAMLLWVYIRALSRNLERCAAQNERYLRWRAYRKARFRQRKTHCFYRCPGCGRRLRVPRGKGQIRISCSNCGSSFLRRT